jgi:hypothetical protein
MLAARRFHSNGFEPSAVVGLTRDANDGGRIGMTKAILGVGALLAAVVALAGCGGSGSGGANVTTGGVAGSHHAHGSGNFSASVHGFAARVQTSVHAFQSGNTAQAMASGGSLLTNCARIVATKIAPHASTNAQQRVLSHLNSSCAAMSQAASAGVSGNMTKAKQFAGTALMEARTAAKLSG